MAKVVSTGLDNAIMQYRSVKPVTTGADFVDAHGDPMQMDEIDSQGNDSDTENDSSSIFVPEDERMQTSERTDGAALETKEAWPWTSGVFGIEEPLSIFSICIENIDFLNIDSSIWSSSILRKY